jgi:hypothetical protein
MNIPPFHLKTETDPVSVISCYLKYETMDKGQKLCSPSVVHHCDNPLVSTSFIGSQITAWSNLFVTNVRMFNCRNNGKYKIGI